jgi:uncharacterized membrane-anchored protein
MNGSRLLLLLAGLLVLGAINFSIFGKEEIKREGEVVFLDLAPRDPRSLMQGDYMALRFRLAEEIGASIRPDQRPRDGEMRLAPVTLDGKRIASLAKPGAAPTLAIRYRYRHGDVWLGTNAFFFEEGSEERFARARYGEFRVDRGTGEAVLVGLRDEGMKPL